MDREIKAVYLDLGGVYYTEGFREGLFAIARGHGVDEEQFYRTATEIVFSTGYVLGTAPEVDFWGQLAEVTGINQDLYTERETILAAFKPMDGMQELTARVRGQITVGLLTDQSNWLYELDERDDFLQAFDTIVSSYEEGFSKRGMELFRVACERLILLPEELAFFDDNQGNIDRAKEFGLRAFLFEDAAKTEMILRAEGVVIPPKAGA
jgi:HAD superfamily hydrolase (TIGR01509 family)